MRLIDADALWVSIANNSACYHDCCRIQGEKGILTLIDEAPTIEAEPVRHGKWCETHNIFQPLYCDVCHRCAIDITPYCPHCGAKMDGGERSD